MMLHLYLNKYQLCTFPMGTSLYQDIRYNFVTMGAEMLFLGTDKKVQNCTYYKGTVLVPW